MKETVTHIFSVSVYPAFNECVSGTDGIDPNLFVGMIQCHRLCHQNHCSLSMSVTTMPNDGLLSCYLGRAIRGGVLSSH